MKNIDFKGERINPAYVNNSTFANHIMRYQYAVDVIKSEKLQTPRVLDLACGAGYGTAFMGQKL